MKKTIGYICFILNILLPIQGALILFTTNRLSLSSNLSFWKEILVVILSAIFLFQIGKALRLKEIKFELKKLWPLLVYTGLIILALTDLIRIPLPLWLLGFRFELFWLGFFALSAVWANTILTKQNLEYKNWLKNILKWGIISGFVLSSLFSISSLVIGQAEFLNFVGYGKEASGYVSSSPAGHILDFGNESLRLSGPFSTPNHYAGYLLLILGFLINFTLQSKNKVTKSVFTLLSILNLIFIYLTYSRFALLAAVCIFAIIIWLKFRDFSLKKLNEISKLGISQAAQNIIRTINFAIISLILIFPIFVGLIVINLDLNKYSFIPTSIAKPNSTELHRRHFLASVDVLTAKPSNYLVGLGLGSSGPGAKEEYGNLNNSPIVKYYYPSAQKYFITNADLVVPENWFLQVWLNGGIFYLIAYLCLFLIPIWEIRKVFSLNKVNWRKVLFSLSFFGIFVGTLFLHILENQTVAFIWTLIFIYWQLDKQTDLEFAEEVVEKPSL